MISVCDVFRALPAVKLLALAGCASSMFWLGSLCCGQVPATPADPPALLGQPGAVAPPPLESSEIPAAVAAGVEFLLRTQLSQGAWGRAASSKYYRIWAPVPGAHRAFRTAVTGLCVAALMESQALLDSELRARADEAIERGQAWLLDPQHQLRRSAPDAYDDTFGYALYSVWGHAYAIHGLVLLHERAAGNAPVQAAILASVQHHVDQLRQTAFLNGGWGYYDDPLTDRQGEPVKPRRAKMQRPAGSPSSFCTATALLAIREARALGITFPDQRLEEALAALRRQRFPDFAYAYGEYLRMRPRSDINRPAGSLGRSQVCNLALHVYGDPQVSQEVLRSWLDRLFARNGWLGMGRKRHLPGASPHSAAFGVAGYFYYYGHYYAARCIQQLPVAERAAYRNQLARTLVPLQESDGSWWDYILYDYHQQYGTAMALSALVRCQ